MWLICNTIQGSAISKLSWKFGESISNTYQVIVLTSSSDTNYVPDEHEDIDQYDSYAIPSKIMPCLSYPESLVSQNEIPVELSC